MITQKYIAKNIGRVFLMAICLFAGQVLWAQGDLPFYRSFLDGKLDHIEFPGPSVGGATPRNNQATLVDKLGLRLTKNKTEVGAFYLSGYEFSTEYGLKIEFEYMMYGNAEITDGISMFLVDNKPIYTGNNLKYGAEGAAFGYTYSWALPSFPTHRKQGILGAYLAVALDQGNFKVLRHEGDEIRSGIPYGSVGLPARDITSSKSTSTNTASNVTIRGAAGRGDKNSPNGIYPEIVKEGYWGYPLLATRHTGIEGNFGYRLNPSTGMFDEHLTPVIPEAFDIAGGKTFTYADDPGYRKAIIMLEPNEAGQGGGFKVSVTIQHGEKKTLVVENFTYPSTITMLENYLYTGSNSNRPTFPKNSHKITYTVPTPESLILGFTASTGKFDYTNVIKNLRITPFYGASSEDDRVIEHRRGSVNIRPLDNDLGFKKEEDGSVSETNKNLDPKTFRFWTDEYTCVGDNVYECNDPAGNGKWVYDPNVAELVFTPKKGFKGKVSIMYDIKAKFTPFSSDKFRSSLATITIDINDNQPS